MSTNWMAISSPQRLWASFVLAPRWGQLMTFSWSTKARFRGGSCPERDISGWAATDRPQGVGGEEGRGDAVSYFCKRSLDSIITIFLMNVPSQQSRQSCRPDSNLSSTTYYLCAFGQISISLSLSFPIYKMGYYYLSPNTIMEIMQ